jgi:hypothetical protein
MAGKDFFGYPKMLDKAMRGLVREILAQTAKQGLAGAHHFYITFDTRAQGVMVSDELRARYPVDMTIVLQHKYWGLKVEDTHFEVTLTFNKVPEELVVPFHAIRRFWDPSQEFGFALQAASPDPVASLSAFKPLSSPAGANPIKPDSAKLEPLLTNGLKLDPPKPEAATRDILSKDDPDPPPAPETAPAQGPTVVSLDAFRKK